MQFSSRLPIAVHILLCIAIFQEEQKVTSNFLAASVQVNPVMIRKTLGQLKEAGLVAVKAGEGGASLTKDPEAVTLWDIFCAVEDPAEALFHFHEHPNPHCPVGKTIHAVLDQKLLDAKCAMRHSLEQTTLCQLIGECRAKGTDVLLLKTP